MKQAHEQLRRAKDTLNALQEEANDELPAGIAGLEAAKAVRVYLALGGRSTHLLIGFLLGSCGRKGVDSDPIC